LGAHVTNVRAKAADKAVRQKLMPVAVALDANGQLIASGIQGCLMIATGHGSTVQAARKNAYGLAERVYVPNIRYRTDVGATFLAHGEALLTRLGFLPAAQQ